jgi:dihydroflavonol-4-reductase
VVGRWPYYAAKIEMEERARALATELGVDLVFVRPPILLGPGDHKLRSTRNVWKFLHRKMPILVHGGMHFADVRDAARALVRALEIPDARPVYHLDGTECEVTEFFALLEEISGVRATRLVLPFRLAYAVAVALERFHVVPDPVVVEMAAHWWGLRSSYAAEELDWKPRSPRETLRDTVEWLRCFGPA